MFLGKFFFFSRKNCEFSEFLKIMFLMCFGVGRCMKYSWNVFVIIFIQPQTFILCYIIKSHIMLWVCHLSERYNWNTVESGVKQHKPNHHLSDRCCPSLDTMDYVQWPLICPFEILTQWSLAQIKVVIVYGGSGSFLFVPRRFVEGD